MVDLNQKDRTIRLKIVYYGPAIGGKTTNLRVLHEQALQARRGEFVSINSLQDRTILCDLLPLRSGGFRGFDLKLQLVAVPGQAIYAVTRRVVLKGADAVVFVANSAADRWSENGQSLKELQANLMAHQLDPHALPFVLQYNKRDLPEVMELEILERALNQRRVPAFPAVATKGEGVLETFTSILALTLRELGRRYRTMEMPAGQTAEAWAREAVLGMFGRARLDLDAAGSEPEIERFGGDVPAVQPDRLLVRVGTSAQLLDTQAGDAAASPDALTAALAEASTELGLVVSDLREERNLAQQRLEEVRRSLELASEAPGTVDLETRVRRILGVLQQAAGASYAALRLTTGEAAQVIILPPLTADPLSRSHLGERHLAALGDLPEPVVEEALESPELTDLLRAGEPSCEAVALVPLRSAERLLGLALLYYGAHDSLPSRDTLVHLSFLARPLAVPLEASAALEAVWAADRLRLLSRSSAAAVAALLTRLPNELTHRARLDLSEVLRPLKAPGVVVVVPPEPVFVSGDASLLRFAVAALVHLCEVVALERGQAPQISVSVAPQGGVVAIGVEAAGRLSALAASGVGSASDDAALTVVLAVVALHGGNVTLGRGGEARSTYTLTLGRIQ